MDARSYQSVRVWDAPTRIFHWMNVLTVVLLIFTGLVFTFRGLINVDGREAHILLEAILQKMHSVVGYVFVINLVIRFIWAFTGNTFARWSAFLPTPSSLKGVFPYLKSLKQGRPQHFTGHNPAGRLAITAMLILLILLSVTGLIRAATDLYYPPFGKMYAEYVVKPGSDPASLVAGDGTHMSNEKYGALRPYIFMAGTVHKYATYLLMVIAALHIIAVVTSEKHEAGIVSAMISGRKLVPTDKK